MMRHKGAADGGQAPAPARTPHRAAHLHRSDVHGLSHLALAAVDAVLGLVEELYLRVLGSSRTSWHPCGPAGIVAGRVRASTALLRRWSDALFVPSGHAVHKPKSTAERDATLAVLNGLVGDYLSDSHNPLAITMCVRHEGRVLALEREALAAAFPEAGDKLLLMVHGLCRDDLQWRRNGHDHGAQLARDLGYVPLYLFYNTGLHVSANGRNLAALLEKLLAEWPVPVRRLDIVAHSMGGLVSRSACHYGRRSGHGWLDALQNIVFIGTPHHGAPLERGGTWLVAALGRSAYTAPVAKLARIRSSGITDLRHGNLVDEDWKDIDRFTHIGDSRRRIPLPAGVRCFLVAGSTGRRAGDLRERLLGDGLIPLDTALGRHPDSSRNLRVPKSRQWIAYGIHHLDLLGRREVYAKLHEWLAADAADQ